MNIVITNVYSYKNKGDAAIVIALVEEVRRAFPSSQMLIQTTDAQNDEGKYGAPVSSSLLWLLLSAHRHQPFTRRLLSLVGQGSGLWLYGLIYRLFGQAPGWLLTPALRQYVSELHAADLVIACGGGYLRTADASAHSTILLMVTCLNFLMAHYVRRPVYLYSQSIGPVHGWLQRGILSFALNRVNLIQSREDITTKFLTGLNLRTPVNQTADPALLLRDRGLKPPVKLEPGRLQVGVTVRTWFHNPARLEAYIAAMAGLIDHLITAYDAQVTYLPQVIAQNFGDDDRVTAEHVHQLVRHPERFQLLNQDLHPLELIGLCGQFDIFVGTRMHSNIFALINEVPVVAIEYEHKTRGIMRGLGLEELVIAIGEVTADELNRRADNLLARREHYRQLIHQGLQPEIERSHSAIEYIKENYEKLAK